MGGSNSGRYRYRNRGSVEGCFALDADRLRKAGAFGDGRSAVCSWEGNGEKRCSIGTEGGRDAIELEYRIQRQGEDWELIRERILLDWMSCHFGSERVHLLCPGTYRGGPCHKPVSKALPLGGQISLQALSSACIQLPE